MKGGCFSTLSLHRSLHALHSVYGRRDRSGFSSMYRYVTISNHSTFSPYPSKYQTNRCHNLTCKSETSDIQKSKLKRKIFPQYPHESPTCPEEEPDFARIWFPSSCVCRALRCTLPCGAARPPLHTPGCSISPPCSLGTPTASLQRDNRRRDTDTWPDLRLAGIGTDRGR